MKQNNQIGVLFICLGNICRSPAAEGTFRNLVEKRGLVDRFLIDSCGTGNWHIGELPHKTTRKVAKEAGIDLTHKARQYQGLSELEIFDYLIAMDNQNYQDVIERLPHNQAEGKVFLFRDFETFPPTPSGGRGKSVPDPYFGGLDGFQEVQRIVSKCSEGLLDYILSKG